MPDKENGTNETKLPSLPKSSNGELNETPQEVSKAQLMPLGAAISQSTNSIDSTVNDLRSYMKGLFANEPDPKVQKFDVFRVETAVGCARTVNELLKTKLEAIKLARDISRDH